MTLHLPDRNLVSRLARRYVEETLTGLRTTIETARWISASNRYSSNPVGVLAAELHSGGLQQAADLAQYIAASPVLHATDGWSYLGKSLVALLRGDPHRAIHLAYYAELRAAISLLATEGIGVFSTNHFAIPSRNNVVRFNSTQGTHKFAWSCLDYWATLPATAQLFARMIRPQGIALEDWFVNEGGATAVAPQARAWLKQWGVDLRTLPDDRDARNLSSYQPDGIPQLWEIDGRDSLEFARDLWASLEPSPLTSFDAIDRNILRISLESLYLARTDTSADSDRSAFRSFAEPIVKRQNLSAPIESELLRYVVRGTSPHDAAIFKYSQKPASDGLVGAYAVISRATLLLRLASGSCQLLLRAAALNADAVAFWTEALGKSRGLWESTLDDPMDMWADVEDVLAQVESFQQGHDAPDQTFFKIRSELSEALVSMGSSERVAIWSMRP